LEADPMRVHTQVTAHTDLSLITQSRASLFSESFPTFRESDSSPTVSVRQGSDTVSDRSELRQPGLNHD
jgi:hypothetical protein